MTLKRTTSLVGDCCCKGADLEAGLEIAVLQISKVGLLSEID
jgi:hypothetical protein